MKGVGKGILGLFFKPMAGTVSMMSYTTQGINNTPATVVKGMKNMRGSKKSITKPNPEQKLGGQQEAPESKGNPNEPETLI